MQHILLRLACIVELVPPVHVQQPAVQAFEEETTLFRVDLMAECLGVAETDHNSALIPHG